MTAIEQNRQAALRRPFGERDLSLPRGVTSVCSAHPLVIDATLRRALTEGLVVLIEATCNQVSQQGGYTGMTPLDFRYFIRGIAAETGFPAEPIILGGDHLSPNPWKNLGADVAMGRADAVVAAYVDAGFVILKVGPGLTFALRKALYGLDAIAAVLGEEAPRTTLPATMEAIMQKRPANWTGHYTSTEQDLNLQRHFSYSDGIRYYWPDPRASAAAEALFDRLPDTIPETLIRPYLGRTYPDVVSKRITPDARSPSLAAIDAALAPYSAARSAR